MCAHRLFPPISSFSPPLDSKLASPGRKNCGPTRLDQGSTQSGASHLRQGRAFPGNSGDSHACNGEVDPCKLTTNPLMPRDP